MLPPDFTKKENYFIFEFYKKNLKFSSQAWEDLPLGVDGVADVVESVAVVVVVVVLDGLAAVVVAPKFDPMPTPGNPMVE